MKRTRVQLLLIMLILAASLTGVIFLQTRMLNSVNTASEETAIALLSDNANQVTSVLENQMENIWTRIEMTNTSFKYIGNMTKSEAMSYMTETLPWAHHVELVDDEGEFLDQYGKTGFIKADEDLFPLFLQNERICVLRQDWSEDTLMFGIPVTPVTVEGKEYRFLLAHYKLDNIMKLLSVESYAGDGIIRVINHDGLVLLSSDNRDSNRMSYYFFRLYEDAEFIHSTDNIYTYEAFRQSIVSGENNGVHVTTPDGKDRVISYAKVEGMDWFVVIAVDFETVLGTLEQNVHSIGLTSIVSTLSIVVIAVILVLIIGADIMKMRHEQAQLKQTNESLDNAKRVAEQALEIAENANRSKSYFLSNMSHDIRTPMNAIVGFTSLLSRNTDNPEKVEEYTKKIAASSQHLLGLINDVLDMSKIESGKTTLNYSEESIADIISEIDAIIRPQMKAKGHNFEITVKDIIHERIVVDKTRLNQILINLLSNAVKYTPDCGRIELSVNEMRSYRNTAWYEIVVADNGYGMSPEFVKTIFDSFSREEDSRTSKIQGTGLGMAITKQLVDLMGGSITVDSEKGRGSVFSVVLQFQTAGGENGRSFWFNNGISRALVVDDEEDVCKSVKTSMDKTGVEVEYALSGSEAVEKVRTGNSYQLVILDWKMPDMDGIEAARRMREIIPDSIPIMLLTAFDFSELETQQLEGIIDGIITKPFFVTSLQKKLEEILGEEEYTEPQSSDEESVFNGRSIMIVEDNEMNSEILRELLSACGARCTVCENGRAAFKTFERSSENEFDLIFMDVQMPVMNGYEATAAIRSCNHPQAQTIPIIAMTANAFTEDIHDAMRAGMNAHISKPVNMSVIEATAKQYLL